LSSSNFPSLPFARKGFPSCDVLCWNLSDCLPIRRSSDRIADRRQISCFLCLWVFGGKELALFDVYLGELDAEDSGSFADYCVAPETNIASKPNQLTHTDASALPVAAVALGAVKPYASKVENGRVLVLGGSAATGAYICQLCRNVFKAKHVAATSSNVDFCLRHGCDRVFDYRSENWWEDTKKTTNAEDRPDYAVVFDCVGGESWKRAREHLPPSSTFVTFVPLPDGPVTLSNALGTVVSSLGRGLASTFGAQCAWTMVMAEPNPDLLDEVATLVLDGKLKPVIDSSYDFTLPNVIDMLKRQKAKKVKGRQICTIHTEAEAQEGITPR